MTSTESNTKLGRRPVRRWRNVSKRNDAAGLGPACTNWEAQDSRNSDFDLRCERVVKYGYLGKSRHGAVRHRSLH
jgi:hypothetical protein